MNWFKIMNNIAKIFLIGLGILFVIALIFSDGSPNQSKYITAEEAKTNNVEVSNVMAIRPADQIRFVSVITTAQKAVRTAKNDMQLGGIKSNRTKEICNVLTGLGVNNWTGYVKKVDSNSDGKGVLSIEIAPDVVLLTWNNAISDVFHETLIDPESPVFAVASGLKYGNPVKFSGRFFTEAGNCIAEQSLTLKGKLEEPEFTFKFSQIELLE